MRATMRKATNEDILSAILKLTVHVGRLESRFDNLETRFDGLESRFDG
jgi:hypothetical protein